MSSGKIQLPNFLIASLYKDSLVQLESSQREVSIDAESATRVSEEPTINYTPGIKYLGQNRKHAIVILNNPDAEVINDIDGAFLTNVLKACNLTLDDIAIINTSKQEISFSNIKEQLDTENILLFDVEPSSINLPFSIPHFQVQRYAGCTIVTAPAFGILNQSQEQSRVLKSQLWTSLKQMFNIS
jgi:hypothetical protein